MRTTTRSRALSWGLLSALAGLVLWSYCRLVASRAAAAAAHGNLEACRQFAQRITELQDRPSLAASKARSPTELNGRIEQAAQNAELPDSKIVRIAPLPVRRVADTVYTEQPTSLELRLVNLKQLIMFLEALTKSESGLEVSTLRLMAPRRETGPTPDEVWQAEVTLTYLIFSPKTPRF